MTADEFFDWLQGWEKGGKTFELERGEIVLMPSPGELHGVVCALIAHLLANYLFKRCNGYLCTNHTGLLVETGPDTVRGPDIMLFEAAPKLDALSRKFSTNIPRLVVEVLSPTDQATKIYRRISQYLARGVPLVWLVDPEVRSVTVFRADRPHRVLNETETLTGEDGPAELQLRVAEMFALPGQAATT